MSLVKEFKEFAMRGNVVDLAVGVIIGGAFGKIVASLVADVIMPPIGLLTGGVDFTEMKLVIQEQVMNGDAITTPEVAIGYGKFINEIFTFLIVAFSVFMLIKALNSMKRKEEAKPAAPAAPPAPTAEEKLLGEIRDLLQNQAK
jgi:large conductance mechanosensitive channel